MGKFPWIFESCLLLVRMGYCRIAVRLASCNWCGYKWVHVCAVGGKIRPWGRVLAMQSVRKVWNWQHFVPKVVYWGLLDRLLPSPLSMHVIIYIAHFKSLSKTLGLSVKFYLRGYNCGKYEVLLFLSLRFTTCIDVMLKLGQSIYHASGNYQFFAVVRVKPFPVAWSVLSFLLPIDNASFITCKQAQ